LIGLEKRKLLLGQGHGIEVGVEEQQDGIGDGLELVLDVVLVVQRRGTLPKGSGPLRSRCIDRCGRLARTCLRAA
jgi:hypothetical protein